MWELYIMLKCSDSGQLPVRFYATSLCVCVCVCEWGVATKWRGESRRYWWRYCWHFGTWNVATETAGWGKEWVLYWSPSGYCCVINTTTVCWTSSHSHFKTPHRLHNNIYEPIGMVLQYLTQDCDYLCGCLPLQPAHSFQFLLSLATFLAVFIICTIHAEGIDARGMCYWLRNLHQCIRCCKLSPLLFIGERERERERWISKT